MPVPRPAPIDTLALSPVLAVAAPRKWLAGTERISRVAMPSILVGCLFSLSLLMSGFVLDHFAVAVRVTASMLMLTGALILLLGLGAIVRELLYWRSSTRQLAKLVNELRAGSTPLSDLDRIGGGARCLVEPMRSILLDLREQKRVNGALQDEMRNRILSRTDALERQLGTVKAQASRDSLTGLNNRRAFDAMLPQIFAACSESREDLCALMIDVDNFKPLNDTLGHAAGDELLKSIGEIIRSSIRDNDAAFRIGGDEFVVLLPRASRVIGDRLGGRIASLVDHLARPLKLPHPPGLSIGSASLSDAKMTEPKQLMDLADRQLYVAKESKPKRFRRSA